MAADLKDPAVKPVLDRLLAWADVVHHNLRPGVAERLGIDAESVHKVNPEAVYLHAAGWGSTGPFAFRQSFAPMISGYTGVTFEVAGQWNEPLPPSGSEDPGTGLLSAFAILVALLARQRTGEGICVESPQLNATLSHMAHVVRSVDGPVIGAGRLDTLQLGRSALDRIYETADGWVVVVVYDDAKAAALGKVLGVDIEGDQRFATDEARRDPDNDTVLAALLAPAFEARRTSDLIAGLGAAGVSAVNQPGPMPPTDCSTTPSTRVSVGSPSPPIQQWGTCVSLLGSFASAMPRRHHTGWRRRWAKTPTRSSPSSASMATRSPPSAVTERCASESRRPQEF